MDGRASEKKADDLYLTTPDCDSGLQFKYALLFMYQCTALALSIL